MKNRIKLNKMRKHYSKIPNKLYNSNLSIMAIGMYCYLASHSESFNPSIKTICSTLKIAKGTAVKYLDELEYRNIIKLIRQGGQATVSEYEFVSMDEWNDNVREKVTRSKK